MQTVFFAHSSIRMPGIASLPTEVLQNITALLATSDIRNLLCCSRAFYALFLRELARKPLVWEEPPAIALNLPFWDANRDRGLAQNVKTLSVSVTEQISADAEVRHHDILSFLIDVDGVREDFGFANNSHYAEIMPPTYIVTAPLYAKIMGTMQWFTELRILKLKAMRLPPSISSLIHAFPQLRDLDISSCAMSNIPAGTLYDPPDFLERLNLMDIRYPPAATQRLSRRRPLTEQEFHVIAPLITLVKAPNLRVLSLDEETAITLTISPLSPLSNTLQDLQVTKRDTNVRNTWLLEQGFWSSSIIMKLLVICPSIKYLRVPPTSSDSATVNELVPLWSDVDTQILNRLHSYTGPLKLARFLTDNGRIPKELRVEVSSRKAYDVLSISCCRGHIKLMRHNWQDTMFLDLYHIWTAVISRYPGEIRHLLVLSDWSWTGIPGSPPAALTQLVTLEGPLKSVATILQRWRFFREICVSGNAETDVVCNMLSYDCKMCTGLESLRITQIMCWDCQLLMVILKLPSSLQKLEIAYNKGFASQVRYTIAPNEPSAYFLL
jgi:hypothetical protein